MRVDQSIDARLQKEFQISALTTVGEGVLNAEKRSAPKLGC